MDIELGPATKAVLDQMRETFGSHVITSKDALAIYNGDGGSTLEKLDDLQLLQFSLVMANQTIAEMNERLQRALNPRPNRAHRRHS